MIISMSMSSPKESSTGLSYSLSQSVVSCTSRSNRLLSSSMNILAVRPSRFPTIFFFQAEDGIRDHCVTGVQTCALPISERLQLLQPAVRDQLADLLRDRRTDARQLFELSGAHPLGKLQCGELLDAAGGEVVRSEERRVGKEGGGRVPRSRGKADRGAVRL